MQVVPIPLELKDKVEEAFVGEGRMQGIDFEEDADAAMGSCAGGMGSYFKVELPDGRKLVHLMKDNVPFSIQFGRWATIIIRFSGFILISCRQVLTSLLKMPERLDWKACMLPEEEDRADAQAFRTAFAPFDPLA